MDDLVVPGPSLTTRIGWHTTTWSGAPRHQTYLASEALTLVIFEGGLSWAIAFAHRARFQSAFRSFDLDALAAMTPDDVAELMTDHTMIRHRRKIEATIHNAALAASVPSLSQLAWEHRATAYYPIWKPSDGRARSPESDRLCARLKDGGYQFIGPSVAHAFTLAIGVDNGHFADCFRAPDHRRA